MKFNLELLRDPDIAVEQSELEHFSKRLDGVLEICDRIENLENKNERADGQKSIIESIELDLWIRSGAPDESCDGKLSAWFINTSLTGYLSKFRPAHYLTDGVIAFIESSSNNNDIDSLIESLNQGAVTARHVISILYGEKSWAKFVAYAMALNGVVLRLLILIISFRLTNSINRRP